jgi:hypothetical protein
VSPATPAKANKTLLQVSASGDYPYDQKKFSAHGAATEQPRQGISLLPKLQVIINGCFTCAQLAPRGNTPQKKFMQLYS